MSEQNRIGNAELGISDDIATVAALGVLAYGSADVAHHVLGHGGACLALGGELLSLTSTSVACTVTGTQVDLAGPLANLVVGLIAWVSAHALKDRPIAKLLLLLSAAFNLFWFEAQFIFSAATMTDDWAELLRQLQPAAIWRYAFIAVGAASFILTIRQLNISFSGFSGPTANRFRTIALFAYGAAGLTACLTGLRDDGGVSNFLHHATPQGFVLTLGLLFLRPESREESFATVRRDYIAITSGIAFGALSIIYLGPGLVSTGR